MMYCIGRVLNPNGKINSNSDGRIHANSPKKNLKCRSNRPTKRKSFLRDFPLIDYWAKPRAKGKRFEDVAQSVMRAGWGRKGFPSPVVANQSIWNFRKRRPNDKSFFICQWPKVSHQAPDVQRGSPRVPVLCLTTLGRGRIRIPSAIEPVSLTELAESSGI